jgi:MFS family permease
LSYCFLSLSMVLILGWIPNWHMMPYLLFLLYNLFLGPMWPSLEVSVLHCSGPSSILTRSGIYNITWSSGFFAGFFFSGILFKWNPDSVLWAAGLFQILSWVLIISAPNAKSRDLKESGEIKNIQNPFSATVKSKFMKLSWLGNGCSFLMLAGFIALTPYLAEKLKLPATFAIWLSCTFLFARTLAFFLFWKWQGWRYKMNYAQLALWIAPLSLTAVFFSNQVGLVFLGLFVFGIAAGLSYSGSLYYSLDQEQDRGAFGGIHESFIGAGIFVGPIIGASALYAFKNPISAQWAIVGAAFIVTIIGSTIVCRKSSST